jgi:hypothetical protein
MVSTDKRSLGLASSKTCRLVLLLVVMQQSGGGQSQPPLRQLSPEENQA